MKSGNRYIIGLDHGNHLIKTANHIMQNGVKRLSATAIPQKKQGRSRTRWPPFCQG